MKSEVQDFAAIELNQNATNVILEPVFGGDINDCFAASGANGERVFIKANENKQVLQSEYQALSRLSQLGVQCFPSFGAYKVGPSVAMLSLEYHEFIPVDESNATQLAETLAVLHQVSSSEFGWPDHGHIGMSVQSNHWCNDWCDFFVSQRLAPQLVRAAEQGLSATATFGVERVMSNFSELVDVSNIKPRLLHGDLWTGNVAYSLTRQEALVYDPAPYYGDSEVDIAMSVLFGRLPSTFYTAYRALIPAPQDVNERESIYNIYHALNHVNLFGCSYEPLVNSLLLKLKI